MLVHLRVNVDEENIDDLPQLGLILSPLVETGYLKPYIYLLQDGGCAGEGNVVAESQGVKKIFNLESRHPVMKVFYKRFHPAEFINSIFENKMYQPVLRHCGASKNQIILDYKGNVYRCWHGIGHDDFRVGTFDSDIVLDRAKNEAWTARTVDTFGQCSACKFRFICGTGCPAATHKTHEKMDLTKPYCVDYADLIDIIMKQRLSPSSV